MTFPREVVLLASQSRAPCPVKSFSESFLCCYHIVSFNYLLKAKLYWHTRCQMQGLADSVSPLLPKLGKDNILAIINSGYFKSVNKKGLVIDEASSDFNLASPSLRSHYDHFKCRKFYAGKSTCFISVSYPRSHFLFTCV